MGTWMKMAVIAVAVSVPAAVLACEGESKEAKSCAGMHKVTVAELTSWTAEKKVKLFDANTAEFRTKNGIIPGATLLTSAIDYNVQKELPAEKTAKLVFYCANTHCTASHTAAKRAIDAGYTDVSVFPDGLTGWKNAGQKTEMPKPNT